MEGLNLSERWGLRASAASLAYLCDLFNVQESGKPFMWARATLSNPYVPIKLTSSKGSVTSNLVLLVVEQCIVRSSASHIYTWYMLVCGWTECKVLYTDTLLYHSISTLSIIPAVRSITDSSSYKSIWLYLGKNLISLPLLNVVKLFPKKSDFIKQNRICVLISYNSSSRPRYQNG